MTTSYGLTLQGYVKKDFNTCFSELVALFQSKFGSDLKVTGDSVAGNVIGIYAEREAIQEEQIEAVYLSGYIQSASSQSLDWAFAKIGGSRILGEYSTAPILYTNSSGSDVVVLAGSLIKQSSTGVQWQTVTDATIPAHGTIAGTARSVDKGYFSAVDGSIDTIISLVSGWSVVSNTDIAVTGRLLETDSELRTRALKEIVESKGGIGSAIAKRIRNEVLGVTFAGWQENRTDSTVGELTPHSFNFTVAGGTDADIANMIFIAGGVGIETIGDVETTITRTDGPDMVIRFDRASNVDIYLTANITKNSNYPANGNDLVKALLVAYGQGYSNGDPVLNHILIGVLNSIPGILTLQILQDITPTPLTSANITISALNRANIDISNIIVNAT